MTHEGSPRTPEQPLSLEDRVIQLEAHVVAMSEKIDAMNEQTAQLLERFNNQEAVKGMGVAAVAGAQEEESPEPAKIDNEAPIGVRRVAASEAQPAKEEKKSRKGRVAVLGALALIGTTAALMFSGGDKSNKSTERVTSSGAEATMTANGNSMTGDLGSLFDKFSTNLTTEAANADTKGSTKAGDKSSTSVFDKRIDSIEDAKTVPGAVKRADVQSTADAKKIITEVLDGDDKKKLIRDFNDREDMMGSLLPAFTEAETGQNKAALGVALNVDGSKSYAGAVYNDIKGVDPTADTSVSHEQMIKTIKKEMLDAKSFNIVEVSGKQNHGINDGHEVYKAGGYSGRALAVTLDSGKVMYFKLDCLNILTELPKIKVVTPNGKIVTIPAPAPNGGGSGGPRLEVVQQGGGSGGAKVQTETTPSGGGNGGSTVTPDNPPPPPPPVKEEKEDDGNPGAGNQTPAETGPGVVTGVQEPERPVGGTTSVIAPPPPAPPSSETTPRPPAVEGPNQGGNGTPEAPVPGTGNAPGQGQGGTVNPNDL